MRPVCLNLLEHERSALIAALRRELAYQRDQAARFPELADFYLYKMRVAARLIEALGAHHEDD
ncbi:hypothetical protein B0920_00305 [Massilia sp. KIM]|uniref:hypothetical protein n=1 Tax=Massilia sp. KIM TaxID=1955422 RepID=UPI00098EF39E|nr:hypothetical protein [Massilia sp. KIM]OON61978.1 hypothetical protein B0920_00305 [Massilia sp. KIM]